MGAAWASGPGFGVTKYTTFCIVVMPYLTSNDGVKIYYEDAGGNGIPVIFSHGFGSGSKLWRFQVPALKEAGYRPIIWDMRAHAKSEGPDDSTKYSKMTQVNDLKAVCDTCGVKSSIFVGHSMGGYDMMLFNLRYPTYVAGWVLYATGPGFSKEKGRIGWNKTADKMARKYDEKGLGALVGSDKHMGHRNPKGLAHAVRGFFAQRKDDPLFMEFEEGPLVAAKRISTFTVPTHIIVGARDKGFGKACDMMHAKIQGSKLTKIPNAGHMAAEKNPEEFNTILLGALQNLKQHIRKSKL